MVPVVVGAGDLHWQPRLEFAEREDGTALGILVAAHLRIRERRAGQHVDRTHHRPDQALDVPPGTRGRRRAILRFNAVLAAGHLQGAGVELCSVAHQEAGR